MRKDFRKLDYRPIDRRELGKVARHVPDEMV